ncbi:MAG: hypothetical protein M3Q65_23045 [Chloroflexota bacterium]|nr:hypothetical protein [Chloroflexota bacterium]
MTTLDQTRPVRCPDDYAPGQLSTYRAQDRPDSDTGVHRPYPTDLGNARGTAVVPAADQLTLRLTAAMPLDLASLAALGPADLHGPDLGQPWVGDADVAHLAGLTGLQALSLATTGVTDAGLAALRRLTDLEELDLAGIRLTDLGLRHLAGPRALAHLDLTATRVGDAGLRHPRGFTALEWLDLSGTEVWGGGLAQLWALQELGDRSSVPRRRTTRDWPRCPPLAALWYLHLDRTAIGDASLARLARLPQLRCLALDDTAITDRGLEWLDDIAELDEIASGGTRVTSAGLRRLRRVPPQVCVITWNIETS